MNIGQQFFIGFTAASAVAFTVLPTANAQTLGAPGPKSGTLGSPSTVCVIASPGNAAGSKGDLGRPCGIVAETKDGSILLNVSSIIDARMPTEIFPGSFYGPTTGACLAGKTPVELKALLDAAQRPGAQPLQIWMPSRCIGQ